MRQGIPKVDRHLLRRPTSGPLNPTLLLFAGAVSSFGVSTILAIAGRVPLTLCAIVNGVCLYCLYTVTHEAVHRLAHPNSNVNDWLGRVAAALEGLTFPLFRVIHLQHHAHTNDPRRDPDYVIGRKPRWLLPLWTLVRLTHDNLFVLQRRLWRGKRARLLEHLATLALQVAAVTAASAFGQLQTVVMLWIAPVVISGMLLELTVAWVVHYPHESQHPLENTRLYPGLLWQVLTLNQNYHLVHHLWTGIPWYRYRAAAATAITALEHRRTSVSSINTQLTDGDLAVSRDTELQSPS